jgi:ferrous iron transport protein A
VPSKILKSKIYLKGAIMEAMEMSLPPIAAAASDVVSLSQLGVGEHGSVVAITGGRVLLGRMSSLGFTPGAELTVVQNFGRGPLIVCVRGARIALGRGEAMRIQVRRRPA